jgi:tetratricopeptide (TPR) repeat protein
MQVDPTKLFVRRGKSVGNLHHDRGLASNDNVLNVYAGAVENLHVPLDGLYEKPHENALGKDHTSTLNTVNNLGLLYADQGKLEEAEQMYQRALQDYEKTLGVDLSKTYMPALNTCDKLVRLRALRDRLEEAVKLLQRALIVFQNVLGPSHE